MSLSRHLLKLKLIDELIRRKATGNQLSFSKKVSLSRSHLNNYLQEMKILGFPIEYDRKRQSYYYKESGRLVSCLFGKELLDNERNDA
jgi:hypothetical protein